MQLSIFLFPLHHSKFFSLVIYTCQLMPFECASSILFLPCLHRCLSTGCVWSSDTSIPQTPVLKNSRRKTQHVPILLVWCLTWNDSVFSPDSELKLCSCCELELSVTATWQSCPRLRATKSFHTSENSWNFCKQHFNFPVESLRYVRVCSEHFLPKALLSKCVWKNKKSFTEVHSCPSCINTKDHSIYLFPSFPFVQC